MAAGAAPSRPPHPGTNIASPSCEEAKMKILKVAFMIFVLCAVAYPQTENLGMGSFANEHGAILLAVDAKVALEDLNSPYLMFVVYMASKNQNKNIEVGRNDVTMIWNGQEYKMPSVQELRKNYLGEIRDIDFYRHLNSAGIVSSWVRFYRWEGHADFFPALRSGQVPVDAGSMSDSIGFTTKCYFKNPGLKKGDKITFKVRDIKDPNVTSEVDVTL
jgi:hypothetical protein